MEKFNYIIEQAPKASGKAETICLPASKSISNRALIISALTGECQISNVADCDDTNAMRKASASPHAQTINIGAAGTAMRFLTAYFAMQPWRTVTLDGSPRMRRRPIGELVEALRHCGAEIDYIGEEGFLRWASTAAILRHRLRCGCAAT